MTFAIKYGFLDDEPLVDTQGRFAAHGGGAAIVERLFKVYPEAVLVGHENRPCEGFSMRRLDSLDAGRDLVINLDVLDSVGVFQLIHRHGAEPRILNLQWLHPSHYHHKVNFAAMALSFALFPTLCSGERTAGEVTDIVRRWTIRPLAHQARIDWFQPGIRNDMVLPHVDERTPVVLYPAIHLSDDKRPREFLDVVGRVARDVPLEMDARLSQRSLTSVMAMKMSSPRWAHVSPLFGDRQAYWESLARTTAFLATAEEEAYGFEYLEAMLAGAVGVLPRRPWARSLVPTDYPYFYDDREQAADMLTAVLRDPAAARGAVDTAAGGSMEQWIMEHHTRSVGNQAVRDQIAAWFPDAR